MIELFFGGKEDGLPDAGRLDELGLWSGSTVFMLHRPGWCWEECGPAIALSEEGLVATKEQSDGCSSLIGGSPMVSGGEPMIEGRHYWEVELAEDACYVMVGAVRPGLDHDKYHANTNDAFFIFGHSGGLWGNGKLNADGQGHFTKGDRIGVLLDLDAGWMHFYRNGKRCAPGYATGAAGPLVRAVQFGGYARDQVTVLPGAVAPEGAGDATEPQEAWKPEDDDESE